MDVINIRGELRSDIPEIRRITELAFREMSYAAGDEHDVVDRLRSSNALSLSLVAAEENRVIGHAAFSPVTVNSEIAPWFALGPVSVTPERQGQGIGSKLIRSGLEQLQSTDALGCILTGNPDYYRRFGFNVCSEHCPACEPQEYFMINQFRPTLIAGQFAFHPAFYNHL